MEILTNDAGEKVALIGDAWVPYAENEAGEGVAFQGGQWGPVSPPMVSPSDLESAGLPQPQGIITDVSGQPGLSDAGVASGIAGSALQGASAEWADEILAAPMAGVAQLSGDAPQNESVVDTYSRMKDSLRTRQKAFEQGYPTAAGAAKLTGGMLPMGKVMDAGGLVKTAAVGGGYGAAEYAGSLDDWSDADLLRAATQTGLGAALPAGLQAGGNRVRKWLANRGSDEVAAVIRKLQEQTGATPQQLRNRATDMGPEASLVDVTGDAGIAYAQGARTQGGIPATDVIERNLVKTQGAKDRIRKTMQDTFGVKEGQYFDELDRLKDSRRANAEGLYGKALDEGSVLPTKRMLSILDNERFVKDAWEEVQTDARINNEFLPKLYDYDTAGKAVWTGDRFPSMRAMQKLKWKMDAKLRAMRGSTDADGKEAYRQAKGRYDMFMEDVNRQNPEFRKANAQYAGDSAMIEAQETGLKHGLGSKDVEQHLEYIKGLNKSEKDAYLQGTLSSAYGKLGTSPEHVAGNINQLASENSRKVLDKLVGKDGAKRLMKRINSERRYREVDTKLRQGSQTELRQAASENMKTEGKKIPFEQLATPVMSAARATIQKLMPKMSKKQVTDIANILTKPGGVDPAMDKIRLEMIGLSEAEAEGLIARTIRQASAVAPTLMDPN